jgi:hypothetical protein
MRFVEIDVFGVYVTPISTPAKQIAIMIRACCGPQSGVTE